MVSASSDLMLTYSCIFVHDWEIEALLQPGEEHGCVRLPVDVPDVMFGQSGVDEHQMLEKKGNQCILFTAGNLKTGKWKFVKKRGRLTRDHDGELWHASQKFMNSVNQSA